VGVGRLDVVGELNVGELRAPDDQLLLLGAQRVPGGQVVGVLLHDDVAAAGKRTVLVADDHGVDGGLAFWVLGPVDEAQQVALVERAKAVYLVDHAGGFSERLGQPLRQLEAQILTARADVEQQIAGR
jgi:hypothetical protein